MLTDRSERIGTIEDAPLNLSMFFIEVAEVRAKAASVRDAPGEVVAVERRLAHCA